jgi:hypothetical protein
MLVADNIQTVEVFKTNIQNEIQGKALLSILSGTFLSSKINIDLDDCDKVLRVEGDNILPGEIIKLVSANGYECKILE